jgi:MFS family permease
MNEARADTPAPTTEARPSRLWALTGGRVIFQEPSFRRYWMARFLSQTGQNALFYTLLILVVDKTGSSIYSSLLVLSFIVPSAVLGTISGVVTDRLPRGLLISVGHLTRALLIFGLAASDESVWIIYAVGLALAAVSQLASPAESALLPEIVSRDRLTIANSMFNLGSALGQLMGAVIIAPLFLMTVGADPVLLLVSGLYVAAGLILPTVPGMKFLTLSAAQKAAQTSFESMRAEFAEGWQTLRRDRPSYMSVAVIVLSNTSLLVMVALAPRFAQDVLDVSTENSIYVFAPAAVGIFLGLRLVEWMTHQVSKSWVVTWGFTLVVVSLVALALVPQAAGFLKDQNPFGTFDPGPLGTQGARLIVTIVFASVAGFAFSVVNVAARSLLHERIPIRMQGRVFAAQTVLSNLASIVPLLLAGALADLVGVAPVLIVVAAAVLAAAAWTGLQSMRPPADRAGALTPRELRL